MARNKNPRNNYSWDPRTDQYWWRFCYNKAPKSYHPFGIMYGSGSSGRDPDGPHGNWLRVSGFGRTLILSLPAWLKPDAKLERSVRFETLENGAPRHTEYEYVDYIKREYGFSISGERDSAAPDRWGKGWGSVWHLSVHLGRQTHDSSTTQDWTCFLPWTDHRVVRHTYHDHAGTEVYREPQPRPKWNTPEYEANEEAIKATPRLRFLFKDYDGESLTCTTRIEEMVWRKGTGKFAWLGYLRAPLVKRYLDLRFSGETGNRKGSWKGGTLGTSIRMLPGELHAAAFERYCAENRMTYMGPV